VLLAAAFGLAAAIEVEVVAATATATGAATGAGAGAANGAGVFELNDQIRVAEGGQKVEGEAWVWA
jgi:predicted outer membrane lipoprotein